MRLLLVLLVVAAGDESGLDRERSPYLKRCAADSVAWRSWGDAAFDSARREAKPVFVSVGDFASLSSLRRDRALFRDRQVAALLTRSFVSVKVDLDERPDIPACYTVAYGLEPGWSAAVLASDGRLIEAVPVAATQDAAAFLSWLQRWSRGNDASWRRWTRVSRDRRELRPGSRDDPAGPAAAVLVEGIRRRLSAPQEVSGAPVRDSTLPPTALLFLLAEHERTGDLGALRAARVALESMARGPLRDHVGGGFYGRAVDHDHPSPDLAKVLGHNALLLRAFAEAAAATGDLLLLDVARETSAWMIREMRDVTGVFWSAVSAGEDGAYYLWTAEEVERWLGPDRAQEFQRAYRIEPPGLLVLSGSPFAGLGSSREVLMNRRGRRVRPPTDDRVFTGWEGLAIGALARSGRLLQRGADVEAAQRAAAALLQRVGPPNALKRIVRGSDAWGSGLLEDHAYLADGLLDLHAATGEPRWRDAAQAVADAAVLHLWDPSGGGFFETDGRDPRLPARLKRAADGGLPSANAVMASVLVRLARLTGAQRYRQLAGKTLAAFLPELERGPEGLETLAGALAEYLTLLGAEQHTRPGPAASPMDQQ